MTIETVASVAW